MKIEKIKVLKVDLEFGDNIIDVLSTIEDAVDGLNFVIVCSTIGIGSMLYDVLIDKGHTVVKSLAQLDIV